MICPKCPELERRMNESSININENGLFVKSYFCGSCYNTYVCTSENGEMKPEDLKHTGSLTI